jgi:hypothetical protein
VWRFSIVPIVLYIAGLLMRLVYVWLLLYICGSIRILLLEHMSMLGGSVTTALHILRLQMEERSPAMEGSCELLNKQSWTNDKGCPPSWGLGVGRR